MLAMHGQVRQAVILAGGEGKRLRPLTLTTPKPLLPIHGKPFAEYLIELLKKNGIQEIIFLTGYLAEKFPQTLGDGSRSDLSIKYSQSPAEDDTGTRLRKAKNLFDERFLLLYGDNYWPLDLVKLLAHHEQSGALATVTVYERIESEEKKNNILVQDGLVRVYDKKRQTTGCNGVDIGFFILKREVLDLLPADNKNFESVVLPKLIEQKKLAGFLTKHPYWSLTDKERLPSVERALNPSRKVLFLDRDGTLNKRQLIGTYITKVEQFEFLPGTVDALERLARAGYEFYVITNQPGIARGDLTRDMLDAIHDQMQKELAKCGVVLKGIYSCHHDRDAGCECRKPKAGMLYRAAREHDIDLSRAIFVGDDERDGQAAAAAGTPFISVPSDIGIAAAIDKLV